MHKKAFGDRVPPGLTGGAYSTPPDPIPGFKGPLRNREGRARKGMEGTKGRANILYRGTFVQVR